MLEVVEWLHKREECRVCSTRICLISPWEWVQRVRRGHSGGATVEGLYRNGHETGALNGGMEDRQLAYLLPCGFPDSASCWSWGLVQSNGWVKGGLEKEDLCGPLEMGVERKGGREAAAGVLVQSWA